MIDLSKFTTKAEIFDFLQANKKLLIAQKKSANKEADAINGFIGLVKDEKVYSSKAFTDITEIPELDVIQAKLAINATNILDSHGDVHIPGLWTKSIQETRYVLHLQEHKHNEFDKVISDEVIVTAEKMSWKKLGQDYVGTTEVLVFLSTIREDRNEDMFERYVKGYVKQHSVGMRYVTLFLCIDSDEQRYAEEKKNWDKYFPMVVNSEDATEQGFFWAVTEAKFVEGSAVVLGSCKATPTLEITGLQPSGDTVEANKHIESSRQSDTILNFKDLKIIK